MRIAVTGSIAADHLMVFPGKFNEQFVDGQLDKVSLSFLVDELQIRRGGTGGNIAYGLGLLGLSPVLVGAVGADFTDYDSALRAAGVDTSGVRVSATRHTARFVCTTDQAQNQIGTFYRGAMVEASEIALATTADRLGGLDLVVISANDPAAMVRHSAESRESGYPFLADFSQQLAVMDGAGVRQLVDGASYLFTNEYEANLLCQKTGWPVEEVLQRVGLWVTTLGAEGAMVRAGGEQVTVPAVPLPVVVDPTGAGDAFRSGFIAGLAWGLDLPGCAQLGCAMASLALEVDGPQEYGLESRAFLDRLAETYGAELADRVEPRLTTKE